jgi:hypothetical protein
MLERACGHLLEAGRDRRFQGRRWRLLSFLASKRLAYSIGLLVQSLGYEFAAQSGKYEFG